MSVEEEGSTSIPIDGASFWARIPANAIPSKPHLHETFLSVIEQKQGGKFLDLGCGDGRLTLELARAFPAYEFLGIDVNSSAIVAARDRNVPDGVKEVSFEVADIVSAEFPSCCFKVVLLQLVVSVIGAIEQRRQLLKKIRNLLTDDGVLLMSASGASEDINPEYAQLYQQDEPLTGEVHTYFSRAADGSILYPTHHFTQEELVQFVEEEGFQIARCIRERESSSRRPDQAAWFFYLIAQKTSSNKRTLVDDSMSIAAELPEPCIKRARRGALTPSSDAYAAAVFAGLSAMTPFADESEKVVADSSPESSDVEDNAENR